MSRIVKGYEAQFGRVLEVLGARRIEDGIRRIVQQARNAVEKEHLSLAAALAGKYKRLISNEFVRKRRPPVEVREFFCDAGLGGLARWIRASGYPAHWVPRINDTVLVEAARGRGAVLLTTDSMLMERRLLRDRVIMAFWLPPAMGNRRQLELVMQEFSLPLRAPLCMNCGGVLRSVDKQHVTNRIPPKTFRWLNDYYLCAHCGQLFWHGTHWTRIREGLELAAGPKRT